LATETHPPNALSRWLKLNQLSINALAKRIGASPHTVKNMAHGATSTINTEILKNISFATGLNYEQLIDSPVRFEPLDQSGDARIDTMLGLIAKNLHSKHMASACRRYVAKDFRCSGRDFNLHNRPAINYDEMCALNALKPGIINSILTSCAWYNPQCDENDSTTLHTYWRAYISEDFDDNSKPAETSNETFVVLELEKSINQMRPIDSPKIKTWWWDLIDHSLKTKKLKATGSAHSSNPSRMLWPTPEQITKMPEPKNKRGGNGY
jgi:hypothetical protein